MNFLTQGPWRSALGPMAMGIVMAFFFVWLFSAALHQPAPHDVRVGVVAPAAVTQRVGDALRANAPGAFAVTAYASEEAARQAIRSREIAGAVVVGTGAPKILVASAAGQSASGAISAAFTAVAQAFGQSAAVEDVEPLPSADSRGLVPFFLVLGVSVSAFLFYLSLSGAKERPLSLPARMISLLVFSVVNGLLAAIAVCIVIGFDRTYWSLAGVCVLLALAVSSATAACLSLFGKAGVGVAGLVLILLGNASSGSVIGAAFLPQPFRGLSGVLPAGPGLEAVRSALYFGGAGARWHLVTLAVWVAASFVVLTGVGLWKRAQAPRLDRIPA
jgi:hypothetical protein